MSGLSTNSTFRQMVLHNPNMRLLSPEETRAVQRVLLSMLDDIHALCQTHRLTYAICGGAALGAVRHGGFIPWDDDIDLCMPRRDYDTFRDLFLQTYGKKYHVQEIRISKGYDLNFMKVRLKDSSFVEPLDPEPEKAGVFIDIFPAENVYTNRALRSIQWLLCDGMQFICSCVRIRNKRARLLNMAGDDAGALRAIRLKSLIALPFCILPFRAWLLLTEKALHLNGNHGSPLLSIPTGIRHFKGELYPRKCIFPGREMSFEGGKYFLVAEPDRYLRQLYGNYWEIPPEEERERHAVLDFRLPETAKKA